ncbi:MAG: carbamoyl-phosphate synthase subunit L, partial [bacterium]
YLTHLSENERKILKQRILTKLQTPRSDNIFYIRYAILLDASVNEIHNSTKIDKWFLNQLREIVEMEKELRVYEF